ncbi:hypothetical protein MRB53_012802 [Persea americana]|uniref:Uncharacterized protein n=1 Tax=Persea americana TaxID=3435 RepID=A0ACC2LYR1_PERAE|nr:hypothetical protein MRB53_012802 [Persea americana]
MAFCATRRPNFSFHLLTSPTQNPTSPSKSKTLLYPKNPFFLKPPRPHFISASVVVSKDNKPISEKPQSSAPPPEDDSFPSPSEEEPKLDRRQLEERFAILNIGIYECRSTTPRTQFRRGCNLGSCRRTGGARHAGGVVVLREQERGVWARRECTDIGAEGDAHLW